MLSKVVVLCVFVTVASAAVSRTPLQPKPEKYKDIDGCYITESDEVIPFGATVPSKTACEAYFCTEYDYQTQTCGAVDLDVSNKPNCYEFEDKELSYPDCCTTIKCDE